MKTKKTEMRPILRWAEEIGWEKRVKAVCKPCWEIKYCPYGPLVEDFPLKKISDERSCRIFGHDCPVFNVAEPLTETKELRRISRSIPRVTQIRVVKRENQICQSCGKSVRDEDIEFDHVIPWSKGGSSDESNIRLLCKACNRKRGERFEEEYLVDSIMEHIIEPVRVETCYKTFELLRLSHEYYRELGKFPTAVDICRMCGRRKIRYEDEALAEIIKDINEFFSSERPAEIKKAAFEALKYRWGFIDREVHKLKEAAKKYRIKPEALLSLEIRLIHRLGWNVQLSDEEKRKWLSQ